MPNSTFRCVAVAAFTASLVTLGGTGLAVDPPAAVTAPVSPLANIATTTVPPRASTATGALFAGDDHFCTASVVASPGGNLVLTAAHCVAGSSAAGLSFAPGYHDGVAPYGFWEVTDVVVPQGWTASADPDLDFAFLTVHQDGNPESVQQDAGADTLGFDRGYVNTVTMTGYPDTTDSPVVCRDTTSRFGPYQQRIACPGFPDGTSGGPWLVGPDPATGNGTVIGVIGGYEQGGRSPDVSYSAYFDSDVLALYRQAIGSAG